MSIYVIINNHIIYLLSIIGAIYYYMSKYLPQVLIGLLSGAAIISLAISIFFVVKTVRHQYRLRYSITIISLRTNKFFYFLLDILLLCAAFFCIAFIVNPVGNFLTKELFAIWKMNIFLVRITLGLLLIIIISVLAISVMLSFAKNAVVNDGIFTSVYFFDWHHLYDFYFEKKGNSVVISNNRNGALTLSGTSSPLVFKSREREKLKFILNKNKNKFVSRI